LPHQLKTIYQNPEFLPVTSTGDKWGRDYIVAKPGKIDRITSCMSGICNAQALPVYTLFSSLLAAVRVVRVARASDFGHFKLVDRMAWEREDLMAWKFLRLLSIACLAFSDS
jgi:hypothetical protein